LEFYIGLMLKASEEQVVILILLNWKDINSWMPISTSLLILLNFLFYSKLPRALTPSGHNDPVCWDVDNCDKKTRNIFLLVYYMK